MSGIALPVSIWAHCRPRRHCGRRFVGYAPPRMDGPIWTLAATLRAAVQFNQTRHSASMQSRSQSELTLAGKASNSPVSKSFYATFDCAMDSACNCWCRSNKRAGSRCSQTVRSDELGQHTQNPNLCLMDRLRRGGTSILNDLDRIVAFKRFSDRRRHT